MKRGRDMLIFRKSKMAAVAILDSRNFKFLKVEGSRGTNCVIMPNFVEIAVTAAEIWCFWIFQDGGRVTSVELCHRAKFLQNRSNRGRDT